MHVFTCSTLLQSPRSLSSDFRGLWIKAPLNTADPIYPKLWSMLLLVPGQNPCETL